MEKYRSPKMAARDAANQLVKNEEVAIAKLAASSRYNPDRHIPAPRLIELKPARFAHTAIFIDQVAKKTLVGEGLDSRLPLLQERRSQSSNLYPDGNSLEKLMDDWYQTDFDSAVNDVLCDPNNRRYLEEYQEILEDIITDPTSEIECMHTENAFDELTGRINPGKSYETEIGVYLLIKWALELMPRDEFHTPELRRKGILQSIPFLTELADLEITHASRYFDERWVECLALDAKQGGVEWRSDSDGMSRLRLVQREKRPDKTSGQPVGCPAGFTIESPTDDEDFSAMSRFIAAYVNEAYDRGILSTS